MDVRIGSPTFGQWTAFELYGKNFDQVWIPEGFAHGFYTPLKESTILYQQTQPYAPDYQRTLLWNDADIGIEWPFNDGYIPAISNKDKNGISLKEYKNELA